VVLVTAQDSVILALEGIVDQEQLKKWRARPCGAPSRDSTRTSKALFRLAHAESITHPPVIQLGSELWPSVKIMRSQYMPLRDSGILVLGGDREGFDDA
jgi:hypothetical protein